jgi:hypothetical protein
MRNDYCAARVVLTWAIAFLILAILAAVFGTMVAGPMGPTLVVVFLVLFIGALVQFFRARHRVRRR